VLIVKSGHDDIIPHPVIENYLTALKGTHPLTDRLTEVAIMRNQKRRGGSPIPPCCSTGLPRWCWEPGRSGSPEVRNQIHPTHIGALRLHDGAPPVALGSNPPFSRAAKRRDRPQIR
jgi:hypothetical protein